MDSATSLDIIQSLLDYADEGACVAAVIHSPSYQVFELFTDVVLLAKGGRMVYTGARANVVPYFDQIGLEIPAKWNPADALLSVVAGQWPGAIGDADLCIKWSQSEEAKLILERVLGIANDGTAQASLEASAPEHPGTMALFLLFASRVALQYSKRKSQLVLDVALHVFMGLGVGLVYSNVSFTELQQLLFMTSLTIGMTTALSSLSVFGSERIVAWREATSGAGMSLPTGPYFLAKVIMELPRLLLFQISTLSFLYPMASPRTPFSEWLGVALCGSFAASGWAYIASVSLEPKTAQLAVVVCMLIFNTFSGVEPQLSEIEANSPVAGTALTWMSYARWTNEALWVREAHRLTPAWRLPPAFYSHTKYSLLGSLVVFRYDERAAGWNCGVLLAYGIALRFLAYLALIGTNRNQRGLRGMQDVVFNCARRVTKALVGRGNALKRLQMTVEKKRAEHLQRLAARVVAVVRVSQGPP